MDSVAPWAASIASNRTDTDPCPKPRCGLRGRAVAIGTAPPGSAAGSIRLVLALFQAPPGVTALARQHVVAPFWRVAAYQLNVFALT